MRSSIEVCWSFATLLTSPAAHQRRFCTAAHYGPVSPPTPMPSRGSGSAEPRTATTVQLPMPKAQQFGMTARHRDLSKLSVGQHVRLQDPTAHRWDKVGIVMGVGRARTYEVRVPSGRVYWRKRRLLRPVPPPDNPPQCGAQCTEPPAELRRSKRLQGRLSARDCDCERGGGGRCMYM